jgi:hypothetical protein
MITFEGKIQVIAGSKAVSIFFDKKKQESSLNSFSMQAGGNKFFNLRKEGGTDLIL